MRTAELSIGCMLMLQYEYVTVRVKVLLAKFEIVKTYQPLWYRYIVYHEAVCV